MKVSVVLVVLGVLVASLGAETVTWRGEGRVTELVTTGEGGIGELGIGNGEEVEVAWSYSDAPTGESLRALLPLWDEWVYWENVILRVEVRIGDHAWTGAVVSAEQSTPYPLLVSEVRRVIETGDVFKVELSSGNGATFSEFPGGTETEVRKITCEAKDQSAPYDFLETTELPGAMAPLLGEITMARGTVVSGDERITFEIDPESLVVADGPAGAPVIPSIVVDDGEVTLGWDAEVGADYTVRWSESGRQWGVLTTVTADSASGIHRFTPAGGAAARLYQVIRND